MKLYHSSTLTIERPDLEHSRDFLDFGKGFYLTSLREQAASYAERFILRGRPAVMNIYDMADDLSNLKVKLFETYNEEWLDFVLECRRGNDTSEYDVVIGGIANDKIFKTIDLYFSGDITKDEALNRLKYEKPNNQLCCRTLAALELLSFDSSEFIIK